MITVSDVRLFGRFGEHISDSVLQHCLGAAEAEVARYGERIPVDLRDHAVLMMACHLVSLAERQPVSVRQDALMISYETLGGDGGLRETTYGREFERLIVMRTPKVI